jgi:hypothetical protein
MGHGKIEDQSTRRRQTVNLFLGLTQDYRLVSVEKVPRLTSVECLICIAITRLERVSTNVTLNIKIMTNRLCRRRRLLSVLESTHLGL